VTPKAEWNLDGVDLVRFLNGKETGKPHDALYWRLGEQMAIRRGDWKLVKYDPHVEGGKGPATASKLYNLAEDIGETTDLAGKQPERVKELQAAWDEWNKGNVAPRWGGKK
jgi:arylsulfatase A-like enzyme